MMDPVLAAAMRAPPPVVPVDPVPVPVPVAVVQQPPIQAARPTAPPVTTLLVTETVPTSQDGLEAMGVIGGK